MMKTITTALAVTVAIAAAAPAMAANARHPYANVDRRVDKGGDTGDSRVEQLNQAQLDSLHAQSGVTRQRMMGAPLMSSPMPTTGQ